jgi:hypothetical protein
LDTFCFKTTAQQSTRLKTINNNELKVKAVWVPTQKERDLCFKRILKRKNTHYFQTLTHFTDNTALESGLKFVGVKPIK